jgi:hypothetical protein
MSESSMEYGKENSETYWKIKDMTFLSKPYTFMPVTPLLVMDPTPPVPPWDPTPPNQPRDPTPVDEG